MQKKSVFGDRQFNLVLTARLHESPYVNSIFTVMLQVQFMRGMRMNKVPQYQHLLYKVRITSERSLFAAAFHTHSSNNKRTNK